METKCGSPRQVPHPRLAEGFLYTDPWGPINLEFAPWQKSKRNGFMWSEPVVKETGHHCRLKLPELSLRWPIKPENGNFKCTLELPRDQMIINGVLALEKQAKQFATNEGVMKPSDTWYSAVHQPEEYKPTLALNLGKFYWSYKTTKDPLTAEPVYTQLPFDDDTFSRCTQGAVVKCIVQPCMVWRSGSKAGLKFRVEKILFLPSAKDVEFDVM